MKTIKINDPLLNGHVSRSTVEAVQAVGPAELSRFEGEGGLAAPERVPQRMGAPSEFAPAANRTVRRIKTPKRKGHHETEH
jgi:hypothetical protein